MGEGFDPQGYLGNGNKSESNSYHQSQGAKPAEGALLLLVCLMTLGGHTLLYITVVRFKTLHKAMYVLLLNLTTSELILGALVMPITTHNLIAGGWNLDERLCKVTGLTFTLCKYTSMTSLSAVSLNRYVRVCRSAWYGTLYSSYRIVLHLAAIWLVPVLVNFPRISKWENFKYVPVRYQCEWVGKLPRFYFVILALMPLVQWVLVVFCNTSIYIKYKRSQTTVASNRVRSQELGVGSPKQPAAERVKTLARPCSTPQERKWAAACDGDRDRDSIPAWKKHHQRSSQEMSLPESELRLQDVESKARCGAETAVVESSPLPSSDSGDTGGSSPPVSASSHRPGGQLTGQTTPSVRSIVGCCLLNTEEGSTLGQAKKDANENNPVPSASKTSEQLMSGRGDDTRSYTTITKTSKRIGAKPSAYSLASSKASFFLGPGLFRQISELQASLSGKSALTGKDDVRVLMVVTLVITLFFLAYIPLSIVNLLKNTTSLHVPATLQLLLLMLFYISSICNPFVYGWGNNRIRNGCKQQLEDALCIAWNRVSPE